MRFGIILTLGDPRTAAALASEAEQTGWDGVFTWDGMSVGAMDTYDPWVVMAAMAMTTGGVRLGAIITPPARRRPWKLARETMTLDRLSNGRLVLPVGLVAPDDKGFGNVGEPTSARVRAELLDESLAILEGLWSGKKFAFEGRHYRFGPMVFRPTPVQQPRIPIWVVGAWPHKRSMRRVLRYDGVLPQLAEPAAVAEVAAYVAENRPPELRDRPFDIVVEGTTPQEADAARQAVRPWAAGGATWWLESDWNARNVGALRTRILAGPPPDPRSAPHRPGPPR